MEWEETGWRCGIKYLGFNEEASVSEVIFGVMQGHVKKDLSPEENAIARKSDQKGNVCQSTASDFLGLSWTLLDLLGLVTLNTVQNTIASLCNHLLLFLETEIDPLAVKLENDEEDDLMQLEADAFMMDGEEEELEEDLKDVMKDLNVLPDKCEVPQPDLLPTVTNDDIRDIKKMTVAAQMLKHVGELQTQAMGIINELVEKNPTLTGLQAIIAPAAQTVPNTSIPPTLVSGVSYNPPQTIDLNSIIKPKYIKNMLNDDGNYHSTICDYYSKHWNKTNKHMGIEHFKIKYGPCPF